MKGRLGGTSAKAGVSVLWVCASSWNQYIWIKWKGIKILRELEPPEWQAVKYLNPGNKKTPKANDRESTLQLNKDIQVKIIKSEVDEERIWFTLP